MSLKSFVLNLKNCAFWIPSILDGAWHFVRFYSLKSSERSLPETHSRDELILLRGTFRENVGASMMGMCLSLFAFALTSIFNLFVGGSAVSWVVSACGCTLSFAYFFGYWQRSVRAHSECMDKMCALPSDRLPGDHRSV